MWVFSVAIKKTKVQSAFLLLFFSPHPSVCFPTRRLIRWRTFPARPPCWTIFKATLLCTLKPESFPLPDLLIIKVHFFLPVPWSFYYGISWLPSRNDWWVVLVILCSIDRLIDWLIDWLCGLLAGFHSDVVAVLFQTLVKLLFCTQFY